MTGWLLVSGPETQSGKVNHYLCLTPHTHTHTRSQLFLGQHSLSFSQTHTHTHSIFNLQVWTPHYQHQ